MFAVETSLCERSSFWQNFLSSFLASQYGASPVVGCVELQKGPASRTDLDIPPAFRNDVLRGKQVIIRCGGGFHQECQQPYSPVAKWMEDADVAAMATSSCQHSGLPLPGIVQAWVLSYWCGGSSFLDSFLRMSQSHLELGDQQRVLEAHWQFTQRTYGLHRPSRDGFLQIFRAVSTSGQAIQQFCQSRSVLMTPRIISLILLSTGLRVQWCPGNFSPLTPPGRRVATVP